MMDPAASVQRRNVYRQKRELDEGGKILELVGEEGLRKEWLRQVQRQKRKDTEPHIPVNDGQKPFADLRTPCSRFAIYYLGYTSILRGIGYMLNKPWPYFRQRKAKVVRLCGNVIPINHRSAFNPVPLMPRKLLPVFEASLLRELGDFLGEDQPGALMAKLCLTYRPSCQLESTAALSWARLLAKDLGWRVYEGTYEYIYFNGFFVKLVDKGISVQAILLAWIRDMSAVFGGGWLWGTKDELQRYANSKHKPEPHQRLFKAWKLLNGMKTSDTMPRHITAITEECPLLDRMEQFKNLVISEQLAKIRPRVEEYLKQG